MESLLRHGLLIVLPILCGLLLRWARCPGWAVLGGLMAGLLLGPSIFGGLSPNTREQLFEGAPQQRIARDGLVIALADPQLSPQMRLQLETALKDVDKAWEDAKWVAQRPLRWHAAAIVALAMLGAGLLAVKRGEQRTGLAAPASIGLWSTTLPGALGFVAMTRWWGFSSAQAAAAAAAVAVGPWALTRIDREIADAAEVGGAHLVQSAGRFASLIAIPIAIWGVWHQSGAEALLWSTPLIAIILAWLIPPLCPTIQPPEKKVPDPFFRGLSPEKKSAKKGVRLLFRRHFARLSPENGAENGSGVFFARGVLEVALVPALAACAAVKINPFRDFAIWPVVVFFLLSGDCRWLGAYIGAMLPGGRRWLRTMRLVLGSMACGPTQLAIATITIHTRAIPQSVALALLLGAAYIEISVPLRRHMSRRLTETEEEIANINDDNNM